MAAALVLLLLSVPAARAATPGHGRAWELVTAGPTNGVTPFDAQAWGDDGTHAVYLSFGPMPGASSGDLASVNLATRGPSGWVKQPIGQPFSQPLVEVRASEPVAVDANFASWVWRAGQPLLPDAPPARQDAFYRRAPDGTLTLLGPVGNVGESQFVAASADTQHAVFQSTAHLLPADAGRVAGADAYEFDGSQLRLVGVGTAGAPLSACGSLVGDGFPRDASLTHPVSLDGTRIWVSAPATGDCGGTTRVYLRSHGTHTVEASASACTRADCGPPADVRFAAAARDGSAAFLITAQQLTDDDVDGAADLYRYDVSSHALTRLSAGPPGVGADVTGAVAATSDDGARVYFVAFGALVAGEGAPGLPSLYLSDHGTLRVVATADDLDLRQAAVSSDGRALAFATGAPLLPSDADTAVDVYRYDAQLDALQQASLGEGGRGNVHSPVTFAASVFRSLQQDDKRYMSADGRRVLFVTSEPLLADDVNTTPDVYEWADGTLGLVSSGSGDATVVYGGLSADGSSAFFTTDETLVSADRNGGDVDFYVARLGGGFPDAPPAPPPCADDACQGPPGARLDRPGLDTLLQVAAPARARIHRLGRRARARLAATGRAIVVADVFAAGRVSLLVRALVEGRRLVVARDTADPRSAGPVRLHVQLDAAARRILRSGRPLRLTLIARQAPRELTSRLTVHLRGKR
jgi:hypothetical protein